MQINSADAYRLVEAASHQGGKNISKLSHSEREILDQVITSIDKLINSDFLLAE